MQSAITSIIDNWLQAHPTILRLVQALIWASDRPIISLILLLFVVAIAWSLIKAISRLLEAASLSILRVPLQLLQFLLSLSVRALGKFSRLMFKQITATKTTEIPVLPEATQSSYQTNQQRLAEISLRLAALNQEQNQLLQEAATILNSDSLELKFDAAENKHLDIML